MGSMLIPKEKILRPFSEELGAFWQISDVHGPHKLPHTIDLSQARRNHDNTTVMTTSPTNNDLCTTWIPSSNWTSYRRLELSRNYLPALPYPTNLIGRLWPKSLDLATGLTMCICSPTRREGPCRRPHSLLVFAERSLYIALC